MQTLILASASPRRAELLQQIGALFDVCPAAIDETPRPTEPAADYVERMAREKALLVAAAAQPGALVLGSDTSVIVDGVILGKPVDDEDARATLAALSGRTHQVLTAVVLASADGCRSCLVTTNVRFCTLTKAQIDAYVATGEPMDKAGSYGIQGLGGMFVEQLQGSYSAVVGLPLQETAALLSAAGYPVWNHWPCSKERQS
jgi:septum formation protein